MKIDCGPTMEDKIHAWCEQNREWQKWFAWHPVRVASYDCRWLESVERRFTSWLWEYRAISTPKYLGGK